VPPPSKPTRGIRGEGVDCHGSRPHPATSPSPAAPTTNCRRLQRLPRRSIDGSSLGGIIPSGPDGVRRRSKGGLGDLELFQAAERLDAEQADPVVTPFPTPAYDPDAERFELTAKGEGYLRSAAEPPL
jgi:hypothetical protein